MIDLTEIKSMLSVKEAADLLDVHPSTIRKAMLAGELEYVNMGHRYRVSRDELARWIEAKTVPANQQKA